MAVEWLDASDRETLVAALAAGTAWADAKALLPADKVDDTFLDAQEAGLTAIALQLTRELTAGDGSQKAAAEAALTPTITSVTPATGDTAGGDLVVIVGTKFVKGATVTFGGHAATIVSLKPTEIVVLTPAHAAEADQHVVVTNPNTEAAEAEDAFTYSKHTPTFTSITPNSVKAGDLSTVPVVDRKHAVIVGTNFYPGVKVTVGGVQAAILNHTATRMEVMVPTRTTAEAVNVVITNRNADAATGSGAFTYT